MSRSQYRPVMPVCDEASHAEALLEIERLWEARVGTPEGDRLEALSILVEAYEAKHHPVAPPDPVEAIKFRMEQLGMTRKDLEPMIGGSGRVAEVLGRKRQLSIFMIRKLHANLGIPAEVLIHETRLRRDGARATRRAPGGSRRVAP